jgi:hypothetical protein
MRSFLCIATVVVSAVTVLAANPTATQFESATKEIVGTWQLEFTTPDDVKRNPIVLVGRQYQELVAWYVEKDKPETFKNVRLEDDTLLLTFRPREHKEVEVTFKASLEKENVCIGEATYRLDDGDTGSWEFKGERISESDFDHVEKWQLSFVTPDEQQREALVTIVAKKDQLYGWYTSNELDLPALKVSKDGDQVVMSITAETRDGANVDVTFRGTVVGDRVKGNADYDLEGDTGSFSFVGQRKS